MLLDNPSDIATHFVRQHLLGGDDQDPKVRIAAQKPSREQGDKGRFAGIAENHQQQSSVAAEPTAIEPPANGQVERRSGESLELVPGNDELSKVEEAGLAEFGEIASPALLNKEARTPSHDRPRRAD
jgi:hypothetical protein